MKPAVVVIAYNRPEALQRLLTSLDGGIYPPDEPVTLVISIDRGAGGPSPAVTAVAHDFEWPFGPKEVIEQPRRLGLVAHFRECARLSRQFDGVVLLEDDLVAAPPFYAFVSQALACYRDEVRVAGVCLYGLWFNGFTHLPFQPLEDGSDAFFLQLPYTQGLAFTAEQWRRFDEWWEHGVEAGPDLPPAFLRFGPEEWFPALAAYTAQTKRHFCFPRVSLTTGWGDPGTHFGGATDWLQTPLRLRGDVYRLLPLDQSLAVYDPFFELTPDRLRLLAPGLPAVDFDIDLNATKQADNLHHGHVLTTRPVQRALVAYGLTMQPPELNVVYGVPGDAISLARVEDVYWDAWAGREARRRLETLAWSKRRPSRRRAALQAVASAVSMIRRRLARE